MVTVEAMVVVNIVVEITKERELEVLMLPVFLLSRKDLATLTCESSSLKSKNAPRGCALARRSSMSQATALGARMCFAHSLFFVRKLLIALNAKK